MESIIINSLINIDFTKRYKTIFSKYSNYDDMITKMDKSKNLQTLKTINSSFKIFNPGQYYNLEDNYNDVKFKLSLKINRGFITSYLYIYFNEKKSSYEHNNFAFIYRNILKDNEAETKAPAFKDYTELKLVTSLIYGIYNDFKTEFLRQLDIKIQENSPVPNIV